MKILVTGGAGYIGSHTLVELFENGHEVLVVDNFCNSSKEALTRVGELTGKTVQCADHSICDKPQIFDTFEKFRPDAVLHFAGLKAVGESAEIPLHYYQENLAGSLCLLQAMDHAGCKKIVFSSSATVYGEPEYLPFDELHPCRPNNCYGRTKYFIEEMLSDWSRSVPGTTAILLRYFNPVGAHSSARIGEDPNDHPNNLMPFTARVAVGRLPKLCVFGDDYETRDGSGMRDYIHVVDLAKAHACAVDATGRITGVEAFNIGTGDGVTVFEMIKAFEQASGQKIPFEVGPRRFGDIAASLADSSKAAEVLGWRAERDLADMCKTVWDFQCANPNGYQE